MTGDSAVTISQSVVSGTFPGGVTLEQHQIHQEQLQELNLELQQKQHIVLQLEQQMLKDKQQTKALSIKVTVGIQQLRTI